MGALLRVLKYSHDARIKDQPYYNHLLRRLKESNSLLGFEQLSSTLNE
jgi:hypothetical protein